MSNRFVQVYGDNTLCGQFYFFLDNVLRLYPTDQLHQLIYEVIGVTHNSGENEEIIYKEIQRRLPEIKSGLAQIKSSISALGFQRKVMLDQTIELLKDTADRINTYVEIGTRGRYVRSMQKELGFQKCYLVTEPEPNFSPTDILERGGLSRPWEFLPLMNYFWGPTYSTGPNVDMVSIYIGLHHAPKDSLPEFIKALSLILRTGGHFIIREHDCTTPDIHLMAGLAHDVFDIATGVSWEEHSKDMMNFHSIDEWEAVFTQYGLKRMHSGLLQEGDPSLNTLVRFQKQ